MLRLVGFFLFLKKRVHLSDLYIVFENAEKATEALSDRKFLKAYWYYKDIVRQLTTRKHFIFWWDLLSLNKILVRTGLKSENETHASVPSDLMSDLLELGAALAVETGGTPWQKLTEINIDEVNTINNAVRKKKIEMLRLTAMAQHSPTELEKYLSRLESEIQNKPKVKKSIDKELFLMSPMMNQKPKPHQRHLELLKLVS